MAPLAEAFVRLRSDGSALAGDVRRDATRAGAQGGTVMGREFSSSFRRATRVLVGLGIGTFAVEAGRFALEMADKFELSRSRLETITKNIGSNFEDVSGQVQNLDDRLAAFGFTNAEVEGSVASLETATKNVPKALKDVALAADIARGRNISLEESTRILQRVETGHVSQLARLGIAVKDASGHILSQQQALEQLAATYGGSASHFADTFAGKQQALRAELGNSAAQIGVALLPALVDLASVLQRDVLPPLEHAAEFFDRNRKTIEPLVGILIKLALAYKAVKLAQAGIKAFQEAKAAGVAGTAGAEVGALARGATPENPMYVFVTNGGLPGGKTPIVAPLPKGKSPLPEAEVATAETGAAVGVGLRGRPIVGVDSLKIASTTAQVAATAAGALALIKRLPAALQAQARQQLAGATSTVATGSGFHRLLFGPSFKSEIDPAKVKALETQWEKLVPAVNKGAAAETHAGQATAGATVSLKEQAKALAFNQKKAIALGQGADDLRSAVHNMAETVGQQSSAALKGNSDAAIANRGALRGAVQQAQAYLQTMRDQHLSQARVAQTAVALASAIEKNATATYGNRQAVVALLKQLGFLPGQIKAALLPSVGIGESIGEGIMNGLAAGIANATPTAVQAAQIGASQALKSARFAAGLDASGGVSGSLIPPPAQKKAKDAGNKLAQSVVSGYTPVVDAGVKAASDKAAQAAQAAFDAAKSKMQADFSQIKAYFNQQRQTIISGFATFDQSATSDFLGASGPPKPFLQQLNAEAREADKFTRLWLRLDREGLNPRLLDMFEGLGPTAIPTMQLWASHPKQRRQANRDIRRIGRDATRIGQAATEDKYGPLIHRDLETLPKKIGQEFRHKVTVTLDTKSLDRLEGRRVQTS